VTEVNREAREWIATLGRKLCRGFALVIDYGGPRTEYYSPERTTGTLEAIGEHRRESDPLARPGEVDLTAHVDFTSLAEAAESAGLCVVGFTDQHHFLIGLSRLHFREGVPPDPSEARAFQTLSHPTLLGRAFKVLCLEKGLDQRRGAEAAEEAQAETQTSVPPIAGGRLSGFSFSSNSRDALGLPACQ
jgi:SAM-dependent MidA family methyltransferase